MSRWTDFRNAIEAFFQPVTEEAVNFAHAIEADAQAEASGDLKKAFIDGYTVYAATPGTFEVKIIAGVTALLTELLGDIWVIVKKDAAKLENPGA